MDMAILIEMRDSTLFQLRAYQGAVAALSAGVDEYELDTGQTRQRVRRVDLAKHAAVMDSLLNRYNNLCNLISGPRGTIAAPDF